MIHFQIGDDGDGSARAWHDDHQGPFHLMEVLAENAQEVGAGDEGDGIEPGAGHDVMQGSERNHACLLALRLPPVEMGAVTLRQGR